VTGAASIPEVIGPRATSEMNMSEDLKQNRAIGARLGVLWCQLMHDHATWPIRGHYRCATCGRRYLVPWAGEYTVEPGGFGMDWRRAESEWGLPAAGYPSDGGIANSMRLPQTLTSELLKKPSIS